MSLLKIDIEILSYVSAKSEAPYGAAYFFLEQGHERIYDFTLTSSHLDGGFRWPRLVVKILTLSMHTQ